MFYKSRPQMPKAEFGSSTPSSSSALFISTQDKQPDLILRHLIERLITTEQFKITDNNIIEFCFRELDEAKHFQSSLMKCGFDNPSSRGNERKINIRDDKFGDEYFIKLMAFEVEHNKLCHVDCVDVEENCNTIQSIGMRSP